MLYLDIDGVLNPEKRNPGTWDGDWRREKLRFNQGGGLLEVVEVDWSPSMVQALWDATEGQITWHTSWNLTYKTTTYANWLAVKVLGWPPLPDTGSPVARATWRGEWWKLTAIKALAPETPFVWIDDDFATELDARAWVEDQGGLAIVTDPETGLTPKQVERMREHLKATNRDGRKS